MDDHRLSQLETSQLRQDGKIGDHDRKIAVLESIATEIKQHLIGMEDKLEKQYQVYVETQGTLKAILDFKTEMKELLEDHEERLKQIESIQNTNKGERNIWERFGGLIGGIFSGVVVGVILYFVTK